MRDTCRHPVHDDAGALLQTVGVVRSERLRNPGLWRPYRGAQPCAFRIQGAEPSRAAARPGDQTGTRARSGLRFAAHRWLPIKWGRFQLLAWNDVAPDAIRALSDMAEAARVLLRHLLDPYEDFHSAPPVQRSGSLRTSGIHGVFDALQTGASRCADRPAAH